MPPRSLRQAVPMVNPQIPGSALTMAMYGEGPHGVGDVPGCLPDNPFPRGQSPYDTSEAYQAAKWLGIPPPFVHTEIQKGIQTTLAASAVQQEIVAFRVAQRHLAVIAYIGNGVENPADEQFITWDFLVDGSPLPGYAGMVGLLAFGIMSPIPVRFAFRPGQRISWAATNALAAPILNVSAMFRGWMWSPGVWESGLPATPAVME